MRRNFIPLVLFIACCLVVIKYQFNDLNASEVMRQLTIGRDLKERPKMETASGHHSLSIHLVIVPFLRYSASKEQIKRRKMEYRYVLQKNLAHPFVKNVHILTTNSTETSEIFQGMPNEKKLIISERKSIDLVKDSWQYISESLVGEDVMFANADIYLGGGFEKVDTVAMGRESIMYALSRRVAPQEQCGKTKDGKPRSIGITDKDICLSGKYFGSHDVFLTRLKEPLPSSYLDELNFELGSLGQENVIIWLFKSKMKYCVLNPCSILQVFHYHCSGVRNRENKVRVNNERNSGHAPYTKNLLCSTSN